MKYDVSVLNRATVRFSTLPAAIAHLRAMCFTPQSADYIAAHIDCEGYYRAAYGFTYGEIRPHYDTLPAMPAYAVDIM